MSDNLEFTEKGAKSYASTKDPRVDLFFKSVRGLSCVESNDFEDQNLENLLHQSWKMSPLDTLKLGFYIRDCRGGKGEKLLFRAFCRWLLKNHIHQLRINMKHIPFYGSWKDVLSIFLGTTEENRAVSMLARQLQADKNNLGTSSEYEITLAAKYAPNDHSSFNRQFDVVNKLCANLQVTKRLYRKEYLRPLRSRCNIVEELMCAGRWSAIDYSKVPSVASKRYSKAFERHDKERYQQFLKSVMAGENKMNTSVLHPHEIISPYISVAGFDTSSVIESVEAQWKSFVAERKARRAKLSESGIEIPNILPIIDVSGSMFSGEKITSIYRPVNVSVSLGIFLSLMNDEDSPFYRKWMTFSTHPRMETLKGDTLCEMMKNMDTRHWEASTHLQPVFDSILDVGEAFSVPPSKMPKMIVILSDMKFDQCVDKSNNFGSSCNRHITNWEAIEKKYAKSNYERPTIVFWNLAGRTLDFPTTSDTSNAALVGGFSADILNLLLDGVVPDPYQVMRKAIDNDRYDRIHDF